MLKAACSNLCLPQGLGGAPGSKRPREEQEVGPDGADMQLDLANKEAAATEIDDEQEDQDGDFESALQALFDSAGKTTGSVGSGKQTEEQLGPLHTTVIALGNKPGALSHDTLTELVSKLLEAEIGTIQYFEKLEDQPLVKGAAQIITSQAGAQKLIQRVDESRVLG